MAGGAGADSWRLMWHSHNHGTHNDDTLGHDRILDFRPVEGDMIETNGWTDYLSGEVILTAQHREVDGSTFHDSYDVAGDLIHTLEIVGVVGLAPDLLANEFIIMGPL